MNFPWGILIINVTKSFLIGALVGLFGSRWDLPQAVSIFLTVAICRGYTTFSKFSLDSCCLLKRGELGAALLTSSVQCNYRSAHSVAPSNFLARSKVAWEPSSAILSRQPTGGFGDKEIDKGPGGWLGASPARKDGMQFDRPHIPIR